MVHTIIGTIELDSVHGVLTMRCLLDKAEFVIGSSAPRLFNDDTLAFYETHRHSAGPDAYTPTPPPRAWAPGSGPSPPGSPNP